MLRRPGICDVKSGRRWSASCRPSCPARCRGIGRNGSESIVTVQHSQQAAPRHSSSASAHFTNTPRTLIISSIIGGSRFEAGARSRTLRGIRRCPPPPRATRPPVTRRKFGWEHRRFPCLAYVANGPVSLRFGERPRSRRHIDLELCISRFNLIVPGHETSRSGVRCMGSHARQPLPSLSGFEE